MGAFRIDLRNLRVPFVILLLLPLTVSGAYASPCGEPQKESSVQQGSSAGRAEETEKSSPGSVASRTPDVDQKAVVPEWVKRLSIEGKSYLRYSYDTQGPKDDFNEFNIDRIYVGLNWKVGEKARLRYTLEGGDLREAGKENFEVTTKHFYLEVKDVLYRSSYLRLGQADLPWVPYEEALWGYRFQGTVFPDRSGYLTSTDLGMVLGGEIPKGRGSWQFALVNGEGWKKKEIGKHKDVHLRLTVNPPASAGFWKNFFVAGFFSTGTYDGVSSGPTSRHRRIAQMGYKAAGRITFVGEYLWASDPSSEMKSRHPSLASRAGQESEGRGYSLFGVLNFSALSPESAAARWEFILRLDHLDPDHKIARNGLERWIGGISYRWNDRVQSLLGYERVLYGVDALRSNERRIMFQAEIRY